MRLSENHRKLLRRAAAPGLRPNEMRIEEQRILNGCVRQGWIAIHWKEDVRRYQTTSHGEAALRAPAPPPPAGRLACLNPICHRTFGKDKNPGITTIICRTCWKALPSDIPRRDREIRARMRKVERLWKRRGEDGDAPMGMLYARRDALWDEITNFFCAPEKPDGLEAFLEEMDWHGNDQPDL